MDINESLLDLDCFLTGNRICLNLGCGLEYAKSTPVTKWINVDSAKTLPRMDAVMNLNKKWKFLDNFADVMLASHIIEHVDDPVHFLNEAHRVLKPGGILKIRTPHEKSCAAYHLTHKHFFTQDTFNELDKASIERCGYYKSDILGKFKVVSNVLRVTPYSSIFDKLPLIMDWLFDKTKGKFPKYEWLFPASEIIVILRKRT